MTRGDLSRLPPQPAARLLGYRLGCPRCCHTTLYVQGDHGLRISEFEGSVSFSQAVRCSHCRVYIRIVGCEATLEEGPDVRPV